MEFISFCKLYKSTNYKILLYPANKLLKLRHILTSVLTGQLQLVVNSSQTHTRLL